MDETRTVSQITKDNSVPLH